MLNPKLLGHSRITLFSFLAGTWLLVAGILLFSSYQFEHDHVLSHLEHDTDTSAKTFDQNWPSLQTQQQKIDFLQDLSENFQPYLNISIITATGRIDASTLYNLNQLSYSPVLHQFHKKIKNGRACINKLMVFQEDAVSACIYTSETFNNYLLISLHDEDFWQYWLDHNIYFISTVLSSLFILVLIFYISSIQNAYRLSNQNQLLKKHELQANDFRRLVSNLPGLVYRLSMTDKKLEFVSSGSLQLLGYPSEHFLQNNITPFDLIDHNDKDDFNRQSNAAHFSFRPFEMVYRINTLSGELKWVLDRGRCYEDNNGKHFVEGVMLDITERELVRQQIEFLAIQDPLTELYNRYKFNDELVCAVDDAKRTQDQFAMLFIDLDRFKNINDSLGHQIGDRLLRKVATRLQSIIEKPHFLARMGGDEFVVLMRDIKAIDQIKVLAADINRVMRKPFTIDSYQLRTSCSIGISLCPQDSNHSHILWRYADTAMYQVKNRGGDDYQFFTTEMGDLVQHRISIEHGFIPALEKNQFELYYQPQVDIKNGKVIGAEALIRWNHPELGFISPADFIPIAEETGFIHDLGDWILHESLKQLSRWQAKGSTLSLAVNVSALQITEEFPNKLASILQHHAIFPHSLELEITESLLMENIDFVLPLLSEVRNKNIHFAIDDFGTGYSSLSYLRYLPIHKLKIDRAFVMNLETNQEDVAMVKAIIAMAKNLNLKVLAEGIENENQLEILREQGCESYQGYYFSRPVDKETFYSLYIDSKQTIQSET